MVRLHGKIIWGNQEYPAAFEADPGARNEEGGILVLPWETEAPDSLVPWSFYVYPRQYHYETLAGRKDDPLVDVEVVFPQEEIDRLFEFEGRL